VPEDVAFDEQLPLSLQLKAGTHFTPVAVARLVAQLLAPEPGLNVLDVGSGAGKFCITAARAVPDARFVGVEWRPHLVRLATRLAEGVPNVRFIHADALDLDWSSFDAFYFYNPFAEHLFDGVFGLDHTISLDPLDFAVYVGAVTDRLARARVGTRVVTYHGLGAALPAGYVLVRATAIASDTVELWIKESETGMANTASP